MKTKLIAIFLATLSTISSAQMVVPASSANLQSQIGRDVDGFNNCGVRAVVIEMTAEQADIYDFSINIRPTMFGGLVKAGKLRSLPIKGKKTITGKEEMRVLKPAPINFWIAKETESKPLSLQKIIPADTPGYILGSAEMVQSYKTIFALVTGERMQFSMRFKNESLDRVISFDAKLNEREIASMEACFAGVMQRLETQLEVGISSKENSGSDMKK